MINCLLFWALPDSWMQFDLLAPDVGERIEAEMRLRLESAGIEDADLARLIEVQLARLREAAADGVVLFATRAQGGADVGDPPPGLCLTLALANRPAPEANGGPEAPGEEPPSRGAASAPAAAFVSEARPLLLDDPELEALVREKRTEVTVPGTEQRLSQFQAQAFVLPKGHVGTAVITVTTFDPDREDDARETARQFAGTLRFVTSDEERA